jgi:dihydrofolate reductase
MRKVAMFNNVTLDGFFEGPGHDISWARHDPESKSFAEEQIDQPGTILFGRLTYELMASAWPTAGAIESNPLVAGFMNNSSKIVFSNTLARADWQNTRLVRGDAAEEVAKLKNQDGSGMIIFGSGKLVSSLAKKNLIDEYQFMVNPVVLGRGTPLFTGLDVHLELEFVRSRELKNGNVLLVYQNKKS